MDLGWLSGVFSRPPSVDLAPTQPGSYALLATLSLLHPPSVPCHPILATNLPSPSHPMPIRRTLQDSHWLSTYMSRSVQFQLKLAPPDNMVGWALPPQCRPKRPASSRMREFPLGNPCTELLDQLCLNSIRDCPAWVCPLRDHESGHPARHTPPGGLPEDLEGVPMTQHPITHAHT